MTYSSDSEAEQVMELNEDLYPASNTYLVLPHYNSRNAPSLFKGEPYELQPFLQYYEHLCQEKGVTSPIQKYRGLLRYCSSKIANRLRSLPSHQHENYDKLLEDLEYFYGDGKGCLNMSKVESFTAKWREREIRTIDQFKDYQLKYHGLVGKARELGKIPDSDYNRYFWEGLHESFRIKVENRMLTTNPSLDVSTPFKISKIVKGADYILSPHRFDQHLLTKSKKPKYHYKDSDSDTESDTPSYRPKHHHSPAPDSEAEEESDVPQKPLPQRPTSRVKLPPTPPKTPPTKHQKVKVQEDNEDFDRMIEELSKMNVGTPVYMAAYFQFCRRFPEFKEHLEPPPCRSPPRQEFQRSFPPRQAFNASTQPPPNQVFNANNQPPPPKSFNRPPFSPATGSNAIPQDYTCFGCGKKGHHIRQCEEVQALIQKGQVIRNPTNGMLQWADGGRIFRDQSETWIQAITRGSKQANLMQVSNYNPRSEGISNYIGVSRNEDDACTEDQYDLGWTSGEVDHRQAYGVERTQTVSKKERKKVQQVDRPDITQRVKKLPRSGKVQSPSRQNLPIPEDVNPSGNQARLPKGTTPVDVHQDKFEGKDDSQFHPMTLEEDIPRKSGKDSRKNLPHQSRTPVLKVSNPGSVVAKRNSAIAKEIMKTKLTLDVQEACDISPGLRRELANVVKRVSEDEVPAQEKTGFAGGVIEDDDWETSEDSSNPDEDEDEDDEDSLALGEFVEKEYRLPVARHRVHNIIFREGKWC
jgi:hypothetical protein